MKLAEPRHDQHQEPIPALAEPRVAADWLGDVPIERPPHGRKSRAVWRRALWTGAGLLVLAAVAVLLLRPATPGLHFETTPVARGRIAARVTAGGTLSALITVQVGSQVSGRIAEVLADFNQRVRKDQLIARIDPEIFEAKVEQASAELESAHATVLNQRAQVERARADVENARAARAGAEAQTAKAWVAVLDARRDLERKRDLLQKELIAQSEKDAAEAAHDSALAQWESTRAQERAFGSAIRSAEAQLKVAEAQLQAAQAQVSQKGAALGQAQADLAHTMIRAPLDGIVVSRNVDVGQTVAASLQAPTLFLIAQDLRQMQVDTNVAEADVGKLTEGMAATFTVDAYPGEVFEGVVQQIRNAPQTVQNVVTYNAVLSVENPDLRLRPGMTANVTFVYARREGVLRVPNSALRFRPPADAAATAPDAQHPGAADQDPARKTVWVLRDGVLNAVPIRTGLSDGTFTEVVEGALVVGDRVVTSYSADQS